MIDLKLDGTREELLAKMVELYPKWPEVHGMARRRVEANGKEIWEEQAAVIAYLAAQYNRTRGPRAAFLEIGANRGFSAAVMHFAAPKALLTTLEPDPERRRITRANIVELGVVVRPEQSTSYLILTSEGSQRYDLIFVDGDHKNIVKDLPWFNRLKVGGLFLHHDYSPHESARPCPPVFEALNDFGASLGRGPDVLVRDDTLVGIAGWYRREGEEWPVAQTQTQPSPDLDLGLEHYLTWITEDGERIGAIIDHPNHDGNISGGGAVMWKPTRWQREHPDDPARAKEQFWELLGEADEKLTLSPSIKCACGDHGHVREGKWVAA